MKGKIIFLTCLKCIFIIALCLMVGIGIYTLNNNVKPVSQVLKTEETTITTPDPNAVQYTSIEVSNNDIHKGALLLVNNRTAYVDYENSGVDRDSVYNLKNDSYIVKDMNVVLNKIVVPSLNAMFTDFQAATNLSDVMINSGYRDTTEQQMLYSQELASTGLENSDLVAIPGYSEHHTGYAFDMSIYNDNGTIKFSGDGDYKWIVDNAYKYGFIQRYPEGKTEITFIAFESWHYRYVGEPHAYVMNKYGYTLEEYIDYLKNFPYDDDHKAQTSWNKDEYEIYYVPASTDTNVTSVPVPANKEYTISGNNIDGFIITVTVSSSIEATSTDEFPEITATTAQE